MRIERLEVRRFPVPFRTAFRHASAARREAENLIVVAEAASGEVGYGEGCPRAYVTGESVTGGAAFIRARAPAIAAAVHDVGTLAAWVECERAAIDANPAAFAAVELALLDLIGRVEGRPLEALLSLPPLAGSFRYSAVLGDLPLPAFLWQLWRYRRAGFADFKLKLSGERGRDRRRALRFRAAERLRGDANNRWHDSEAAIAALRGLSLFALEEPLAVGDIAGCRRVAEALNLRIVLDESLLRAAQLQALPDPPRWIANVRVSKLGGLLRSLEVIRAAQQRGIAVVVGAQVGETSLLTRAGLAAMHAAGDALLAGEGAFGTRLLLRDLTTESLMFADGGQFDTAGWPCLQAPGLGLDVRAEALVAV